MVSIWTVVFAVAVTWVIHELGPYIADYSRLLRGRLSELLGGLVGGLTLGVPAALIWLAVTLALERGPWASLSSLSRFAKLEVPS